MPRSTALEHIFGGDRVIGARDELHLRSELSGRRADQIGIEQRRMRRIRLTRW